MGLESSNQLNGNALVFSRLVLCPKDSVRFCVEYYVVWENTPAISKETSCIPTFEMLSLHLILDFFAPKGLKVDSMISIMNFSRHTYDMATGTVSCSFAAGISSLVSFGLVYWQTQDRKKAQDAAIDTAVQVFGPAFAANVISSQIARTGLTNALAPVSDIIVDGLGTQAVQKMVNAKRTLLGQKKIYGAAASSSFSKALRSSFVSEGVMFVAFSVPDSYRAVTRKISGAQYCKNMVSMGAAFLGNIAGVYGSGMAAGAIGEKFGKRVNKKVGAIIGFAGGMVGATVAGAAAKSVTGLFKEDDAVITARLFNAVVANMAIDYFLSEKEVDKLIEQLNSNSKEIGKLQRQLLGSERQYYDIEQFLIPYFEIAVNGREKIRDDDILQFSLTPSFA